MKVLLTPSEAKRIGKSFNPKMKTYRIKKQPHQIFTANKAQMGKLIGFRKGIRVYRKGFPTEGILAFPENTYVAGLAEKITDSYNKTGTVEENLSRGGKSRYSESWRAVDQSSIDDGEKEKLKSMIRRRDTRRKSKRGYE